MKYLELSAMEEAQTAIDDLGTLEFGNGWIILINPKAILAGLATMAGALEHACQAQWMNHWWPSTSKINRFFSGMPHNLKRIFFLRLCHDIC